MKTKPRSFIHRIAMLCGLGALIGQERIAEVRKDPILTDATRFFPHRDTSPRPTPRRRSFSKWQQGGHDVARMEKRAENDERACRLNYRGWAGYEDAGADRI